MDKFILLDYGTLRVIWWLLMGFLLAAFAVMDGFDLGAAALLPILARTDSERRLVINLIGPTWEGNQVWLILGGGAIFAAWPLLYGAGFSSFYLALILLLVGLIVRPVAFKYRSKYPEKNWRARWDATLCFSGLIVSLVCGVALGNVLTGIDLSYDPMSLRALYGGNVFKLFTPFTVLCGLVSVLMCCTHGAVLVAWRTDGQVAVRARLLGQGLALLWAVLFAVGGVWISHGVMGQILTSHVDPAALSSPLDKTVVTQVGAWMQNYARWPILWVVPAIGVIGALLVALLLRVGAGAVTFVVSSLSVASMIGTVGVSMFPFILPSSSQPAAGLTVWDASSSPLTLWIMLLLALFFVPVIILYTCWVYYIMRGKVTAASVANRPNAY